MNKMCDAGLGFPGKGGDGADIRLFTKGECDKLNGNWSGNGECLKKEGGSWSWDCRGLNSVSASNSSVVSPVAQILSGGSPSGGIPKWALYAGGALVALYVLRR